MKPAVLIIDMQPRFVSSLDSNEELIRAQIDLIKQSFARGYLIGLIEYDLGGGETIKPISRQLPAQDTQGYFKLTKESMGLFDQKIVAEYVLNKMRQTHSDGIILAGLYASQCIQETSFGAKRKGITNQFTAKNLLGENPRITTLEHALNSMKTDRSIEIFPTHTDMLRAIDERQIHAYQQA